VVVVAATQTKVVGKQRQKRVPQKKAKPLLLSSSSRRNEAMALQTRRLRLMILAPKSSAHEMK